MHVPNLSLQDKIFLGNLDAKRDWGHAKDYVEGMWKMMQLDKPEDFVLATGKTHSIREFSDQTFRKLGIELEFKGTGTDEKGIIKSIDSKILSNFNINETPVKVGDIVIEIDPTYFRPTEVDLLIGDPTKAKEMMNWETTYDLNELIEEMVISDMEITRKEKLTQD